MCKLIPASEFGMPDPYYRNDNHSIKNTCEDQLHNLRSWVESIELSPYLHPEVEEYTYRVLNTFLHGWFYYPLFKVADTLSKLNLELALKCRYEYQAGQRTSLSILLRRASSSGTLRFELTEAVKMIHQRSIEFEPFGIPNIKKRDIREIASNREKVVTENLPILRAYDVHPIMASVTMPFNALSGIKQNIEYINIIAENSDIELRRLFSKAKFDWIDVTYVPVSSNEVDFFSGSISFANRKSIPLSEVEMFIEDVSRFLGLAKRSIADQLWVLNKFTLLPTKPYKKLLKILNRKAEQRPNELTKQDILEGIEWIARNCNGLLSKFNTKFKLQSDGSVVLFELVRSGNTKKKWKVTALNETGNSMCYVESNDLSYYLFLQLSIWGSNVSRLKRHLRMLKKIVCGIDS